VSLDDDGEFETASLGTRKLFGLGGETYLALGGRLIHDDDADDIVEFNTAYYLNRKTSIDFNYRSYSDSLDVSDGLADIGITWFLTPNFSINASTYFGVGEVDTDLGDAFNLGFRARF